MITNERQYKITRKKLTKLQEAQALSDQHSESLPEVLKTAMRAGIEAQIQDLKSELEEYRDLKSAKNLEIHGIEELPRALIKVRIMRGYTQKYLAQQIGLKEQQIQRYESQEYAGVKLERLVHIAKVLGLALNGTLSLQQN